MHKSIAVAEFGDNTAHYANVTSIRDPRGHGSRSGLLGRQRHVRPDEWFGVALHCGLAGVFIVNALAAWLQPDDFVNLVQHSTLFRLCPVQPGRWVAWAICVNDAVLGILLILTMRSGRTRALVLAWSGVWLFAVTVIKVTSLDVFAS